MLLVDLLVIIIPIAVFDMVMTMPTNGIVLLTQFGASYPVPRALLYAAGFFSAAFGVGLLLALPFDWVFDLAANLLREFLINRGTFVYALQLIIGLALISGSERVYRRLRQQMIDHPPGTNPEYPTAHGRNLWGSFALGFGLSLAGMPSAFTYFAAIDQILKAQPPLLRIVVLLLIYNLIVIAPLLIVVAVFIVSGMAGQRLLQRGSQIALWLGGWAMRVLLIIIGIILTLDALAFFLEVPLIIRLIEAQHR